MTRAITEAPRAPETLRRFLLPPDVMTKHTTTSTRRTSSLAASWGGGWWAPGRGLMHPSPRPRVGSIGAGSPTTKARDSASAASLSVRPIRRGDLPSVLGILNEAADGEVSASSLEAYAREACAAAASDQLALVAERTTGGGSPLDTPTIEVVGLVGLLLDDDLKPPEMRLDGTRVGYITNLAVASSARREGVGATLLLAAEHAAREAGCAGVACRVLKDNAPARSMYSKKGYDVVEPKPLVDFRALMGTLYGLSGVAHAADLLVGPSALPALAGAPVYAAMDPTQRALALAWCAMGPVALAAGKVGGPRMAIGGLVAYGVYEVALAAACAVTFGAAGGDAVTGAVGVQAVVFGCYMFLSPRSSRAQLSLGKSF